MKGNVCWVEVTLVWEMSAAGGVQKPPPGVRSQEQSAEVVTQAGGRCSETGIALPDVAVDKPDDELNEGEYKDLWKHSGENWCRGTNVGQLLNQGTF